MNKQEARKQALEELAKGKDEYLFNCDWKRIFKVYYLDVQHKFSESYLGETTIIEECKAVAAGVVNLIRQNPEFVRLIVEG